ncbi:hypothetical protein BOTNAR_1919g00010 [Botryotinia narcissicola]|uniref:Uncharacterized protein n=1 Tax=Botryotinia narcissicola TaxID=278944 RepID=A0A4Z1HEP9_9HELO|nr:hypothetical protein BOTNAR_1919g00010 [Botryotinia narcissicola]
MASFLPLESLGFATGIAVTIGVLHTSVQNLIINTVAGPGSYSRIAIAIGLLGNLKNLAALRLKGEAEKIEEKYILATGISKYVIKLGRMTIHPEVLLASSGLLPEKPGGWATMSGSWESTALFVGEATKAKDKQNEIAEGPGIWTWENTITENEKGLNYAEHFGALDGLAVKLSGSKAPALGKFKDLF